MNAERKTIRVAVIDDHPAVRYGLETLLNGFDDLEVVGLAADGAEAVQCCDQTQPDVMLMDLVMNEIDGITATRLVRTQHPSTQILILTSSEDGQTVIEAIEAGAIGYILKNAEIPDMVLAIRAAHAGKRTLSPEALEGLIRTRTAQQLRVETLSEREIEVLHLLMRGYTNPEIAEALCITLATVKFHVGSIFKKLNVSTRTEAVAQAIEQKLIK